MNIANKLWRINKSIDKIAKKGSKNLSKSAHAKLRRLLRSRAKALSKVMGGTVHTIFD